jgi:hypothetical protein
MADVDTAGRSAAGGDATAVPRAETLGCGLAAETPVVPAAATTAPAAAAGVAPLDPLTAVLSALEIALFGRAGVRVVEGLFAMAGGAPPVGSTEEDTDSTAATDLGALRQTVIRTIEATLLPSTVVMPDGRVAAFVPFIFLGLFPDKAAALEALRPQLLHLADLGPDPQLGPLAFSAYPSTPSPSGVVMPRLNYIEHAAIALFVARHDKPLPEGVAATPPSLYLAEKPTALPREFKKGGLPPFKMASVQNGVVKQLLVRW